MPQVKHQYVDGVRLHLHMCLLSIGQLTRTTHAYDASHHAKHHAWMGRAAQVSGVARLVGVQRTVQNNNNVKSEPKYLACEESPIRAFYF